MLCVHVSILQYNMRVFTAVLIAVLTNLKERFWVLFKPVYRIQLMRYLEFSQSMNILVLFWFIFYLIDSYVA